MTHMINYFGRRIILWIQKNGLIAVVMRYFEPKICEVMVENMEFIG